MGSECIHSESLSHTKLLYSSPAEFIASTSSLIDSPDLKNVNITEFAVYYKKTRIILQS